MKKSFFIFLTILGLWLAGEVSAQPKPQTGVSKTKSAGAETTTPKPTAGRVTQIDLIGLKNILKPNGKPVLINFWATWCDPCREEFPDLVKIDADYKGKIDVITVSLDFLSEIERDVPKFLSEMKAEMPTYLLKTDNEDEAARIVSAKWQGALPFTILYDADGKETYSRQGKFKTEILRGEIEKVLQTKAMTVSMFDLEINLADYEQGKKDALKDILNGVLIIRISGRPGSIRSVWSKILAEKYEIKTQNSGCLVTSQILSYAKGYNEISEAEIKKRFGEDVLEKTRKEAEEIAANESAMLST